MYSETDILAKAWLVKEITDLVLQEEKLTVDKIFLIGSYAYGRPTEWSDLDFLIQVQDNKKSMLRRTYPSLKSMNEVNKKIDNNRIHLIFGTQEAQESLYR